MAKLININESSDVRSQATPSMTLVVGQGAEKPDRSNVGSPEQPWPTRHASDQVMVCGPFYPSLAGTCLGNFPVNATLDVNGCSLLAHNDRGAISCNLYSCGVLPQETGIVSAGPLFSM
jgi:hypothetical protein